MRIRLKDVAERAGVSVKTVSNVVHGYKHVSADTRAKVQAVLDETDYRPNVTARHLRAGRVGVIALALPELDNPYFAELAGHVVSVAEEHGLTVLVDQTDGLAEREREVLTGFRHLIIDGLILSPFAIGADELARHSQADLPVVLLGEVFQPGTADHVAIDNVAAARAATQHLLSRGRRRVAIVGDQPLHVARSGPALLRRRGWEQALTSAGLRPEEELVAVVADFGREDGYRAMASLLDRGAQPDAVFCFNDVLALGVLRLLADRGVRVPEEIAVIGLDDIADARYCVPRLSTIAPDKEAIARTAVSLLVDRLSPGGGDLPPRDLRPPFEVVVRESTGAG